MMPQGRLDGEKRWDPVPPRPAVPKNNRAKALILAAGSHNLSQIEPSETIPVFVRLANET